MTIRKAGVNDIEQLITMRILYLQEDYKGLTSEQIFTLKEQLPEYFCKHINNDMIAYVAEDDSKIISTVFLIINEKPGNPNFITGKTGTIMNVYTKPEFRKKGIAGKLLELVIQDAKGLNLSFLELKATQKGLTLYKKIGFIENHSKYTPMKYLL
jgi:GNAT superfamily N-acetyltransferase